MRAGVPALTLHALCHPSNTRLIERVVPVVHRSAGRADVAATMRYCSIADDVYAERIVSAFG